MRKQSEWEKSETFKARLCWETNDPKSVQKRLQKKKRKIDEGEGRQPSMSFSKEGWLLVLPD